MTAERIPELAPEKDPPLCPFQVGHSYTKHDIYRIFEVPSKRQNGSWNTGYVKFDKYWFLFSNIGTPGRTGHDYGDKLLEGKMIWFGKTGSHIGQPSIVDMVSPASVVYIFYRHESRSPFAFAGIGKAGTVNDTTPVEVHWEIFPATYSPLPLLLVTPPAPAKITRLAEVDPPVTKTLEPPMVSEVQTWITTILAQDSYQNATAHAGRHCPADVQIALILASLDRAPGRQLPLTALAKSINCPLIRISGILAQVSRILNLDGYQVLSLSEDRGYVRLDKDLAMRQFLPGIRP